MPLRPSHDNLPLSASERIEFCNLTQGIEQIINEALEADDGYDTGQRSLDELAPFMDQKPGFIPIGHIAFQGDFQE